MKRTNECLHQVCLFLLLGALSLRAVDNDHLKINDIAIDLKMTGSDVQTFQWEILNDSNDSYKILRTAVGCSCIKMPGTNIDLPPHSKTALSLEVSQAGNASSSSKIVLFEIERRSKNADPVKQVITSTIHVNVPEYITVEPRMLRWISVVSKFNSRVVSVKVSPKIGSGRLDVQCSDDRFQINIEEESANSYRITVVPPRMNGSFKRTVIDICYVTSKKRFCKRLYCLDYSL